MRGREGTHEIERAETARKVMVVGGELMGCETAEFLADLDPPVWGLSTRQRSDRLRVREHAGWKLH